jgi:hypothetical protein
MAAFGSAIPLQCCASLQVVVEQLLVGVLLLAPLVALLPTTMAFHVLLSLANLAAVALRGSLLLCATAAGAVPALAVGACAAQPLGGCALLPGGLRIQMCDETYTPCVAAAWRSELSNADATEPCAAAAHALQLRSDGATAPFLCNVSKKLQRDAKRCTADVAGVHYTVSNCASTFAQAVRPFARTLAAAGQQVWITSNTQWAVGRFGSGFPA